MKPCTKCGQKPGHALLRWAAVLAFGAALEAEAVAGKRHSHTLSQCTRAVFKTHTPGGRARFLALWLGFAVWYANHIIHSKHNFGGTR